MSQSGQNWVDLRARARARLTRLFWTDDKVELPLKGTIEYKIFKTSEKADWESYQTKYSDIVGRFL